MTPIEFEGMTTIIAKDQPDYLPLPVHISDDDRCVMTSCWQLTIRERLAVLFGANLWLQQYTFRQLLQPQRPSIGRPDEVPYPLEDY